MDNNILFGAILIIVILGAWYMYSDSMQYQNMNEGYQNLDKENDEREAYQNAQPVADGYLPNSPPIEVGQSTDVEEPLTNPSTCYPKDQLTPEELLPQDYSSTWAKCNPTGAGSLEGKNFLDAGWHVGINTVGQTLRNANQSLRSEPPCPQIKVSPWLQSTIEPDTNRRYMEIGNC